MSVPPVVRMGPSNAIVPRSERASTSPCRDMRAAFAAGVTAGGFFIPR